MPTIKKTQRRPWQPERKPHEGRKHSNSAFYQSTEWRKLRAIKIQIQPLCEECLRKGMYSIAKVIDHIKPINQGGASLSMDNLQSLCSGCHNRKSGLEARQSR